MASILFNTINPSFIPNNFNISKSYLRNKFLNSKIDDEGVSPL